MPYCKNCGSFYFGLRCDNCNHSNIRLTTQVDIETAPELVECPTCGGSGSETQEPFGAMRCHTCGGRGLIVSRNN
ncbi:hypothetical protein JW859_02985 [bacterium]|nr:hypothetical protein [bacterium]